MVHRIYLHKDHLFHSQKSSVNGQEEWGKAPIYLIGNEILKKYRKSHEIGEGPSKKKSKKDDYSNNGWKHKYIFF